MTDPVLESQIEAFKNRNKPAFSAAPDKLIPMPVKPNLSLQGQPQILQLVRPSARDRWMTSVLSTYTPAMVENICRGAMSGNLTSQWLMFDLMEQSWPRLSKNLNELKLSACNLPRIVQPFADKDEKPTPEAVRRAKIVDKLLRTMRPNRKKMERDLDDTIYDVLDAVGKGIELSQIIWEQRPVRIGSTTNTLWAPRCTQWVHPRYYGFPPGTGMEEELMLNAREVAISNPYFVNEHGSSWIPIPDDEFIVSTIQQKSGHPVNAAMLRILGFWWAASNFTWEWFLNFAQIFGAPIRWATYDPATSTQDTINMIQQMLQMMGSMGWAAFPAGTTLELKEAMKSGQDNPQKMLLDSADEICDLLIFWESTTSQHGGPGGRASGTMALAKVGQDKRGERIQSAGNAAAKILNESLIPAICRLNFGDDSECPQLLIVTKANKDLVQQAQRYKIILQIPGVEVSKQQFYEDNELVIPDGNDDTIKGVAPSGPGNGSEDPNEEEQIAQARGRSVHICIGHARDGATDKLVDGVLENLTGIEARWLGGVKPFFQELIAKAKSADVTDAELATAIEKARREMPDLFHKLDTAALASAMEHTMSAALVNGAVRSFVKRGGPR